MSNQYYTAKQRADKCVLPLDLAAIADQKVTNDESRAMKKVGYALIAQIQKVILTAEAMESKP